MSKTFTDTDKKDNMQNKEIEKISDKDVRKIVIKRLNTMFLNNEAKNRADASRLCYNYFIVREILLDSVKKEEENAKKNI